MARADDFLAAIEAVYQLDGDDSSWLLGVARALATSIDDGFGVCGISCDAADLAAPRWGTHVALGSVADDAGAPGEVEQTP
jgi:hypothetical protein